jgi:hypothetical protein
MPAARNKKGDKSGVLLGKCVRSYLLSMDGLSEILAMQTVREFASRAGGKKWISGLGGENNMHHSGLIMRVSGEEL